MNATVIVMVLRTIAQSVLWALQTYNYMTADDAQTVSGMLDTFWPSFVSLLIFIWQLWTKWKTKSVVLAPGKAKQGQVTMPVHQVVSPITGLRE